MKCFKHIHIDAVDSAEVRVGSNRSGAIYGRRPVCENCLKSHKRLKPLRAIFGIIDALFPQK